MPTVVERLLKQAEDKISEARKLLAADGGSDESEWLRWFRRAGAVLNDVDEAGGEVDPSEWAAIGRKHGYDPRGLAGFFSGYRPSMKSIGDRRVLTGRGRGEAATWRELFG